MAIPLPGSYGNALESGVKTGSNLMFDRAKELRQQQILPQLLEQYKQMNAGRGMDNNLKALYEKLLMQAVGGMMGGGEDAPPGMQQPPPDQLPQEPAVPVFDNQNSNASAAPNMPQDPSRMTRQQLVARANADQAKADGGMQQPAMQGASNAPIAPQQQPNAPINPADAQAASQPQRAGETVIRPGNPNLAQMDKVAGLIPQVPAPKYSYDHDRGMIITQYPSGKVTEQPYADPKTKSVDKETPQEREAREIRTAEAKSDLMDDRAERKIIRAEAEKIETSVDSLVKIAKLAADMKRIIKENPNKTGMKNLPAQMTNMQNDPVLGELKTGFGQLQADLAKYSSSRGGAQVIQWAGKIKPSVLNQDTYNDGMLDQTLKNAKTEYDQEAARYEKKTGKKMPIPFPDFNEPAASNADKSASAATPPPNARPGNKVGTVVMHKGKDEYHIPLADVEEAVKAGYTYG